MMKNKVKRFLNTGSALVLSCILFCSCGGQVASAPVLLAGPAGQEVRNSGRMDASKAAAALEKEADTRSPVTAEDIAAVSAMNIMCHPCAAAVMEDGSLLVTDSYNRVIWHVADGSSTVFAGSYNADDSGMQPPGGYIDASYEESVFRSPWGIAPFRDGWAVSDTENHVIRLLENGTVQTINAHAAGSSTVAESSTVFKHPTGLASDDAGNLYVADTFGDIIYRITPDGEIAPEVTGVSEPMGMSWKDGSLYVAETGKNRIISVGTGQITVVAGNGDAGDSDGPAQSASFSAPQGIAAGNSGTVYVADTDNSAIRQISNGEVSTLYARDVRDLDAFFPVTPVGILAAGDSVYVCDPFARALLLLPLAG